MIIEGKETTSNGVSYGEVGIVRLGTKGNAALAQASRPMAEREDLLESTDSVPILSYKAVADPGTADDESKWRIARHTRQQETPGGRVSTRVEWAGKPGNPPTDIADFNFKWDDHAILDYF
jgi:hypothetical protein